MSPAPSNINAASPPPEKPVSFGTVLACELEHIKLRRSHNEVEKLPEAKTGSDEDARKRAQENYLVGLAFSGGGIRSATINLGVLEALAEFGLIKRLDYLSTVSGGGFIGGWLSTWIKREGDIENVELQLRASRVDQSWATRIGDNDQELKQGIPLEGEPEPIFHLRRYTSYLAPRTGVFSVDSWVLGAIYCRNFLLNQFILLPALLAVLLFLCFIVLLVQWSEVKELVGPGWPDWFVNIVGKENYWTRIIVLAMAALLAWSFYGITISLTRLGKVRTEGKSDKPQLANGARHLWFNVVSPLILFAFLSTWEFSYWDRTKLDPLNWRWFQWSLEWIGIGQNTLDSFARATDSFGVLLSAALWGCLFGLLLWFVRVLAIVACGRL
jgi:hypothetical protein